MGISELISSIHAAADSPGNVNEEERSNLLAACDRLKSKLESPREAALRPSLTRSTDIHINICSYTDFLCFSQPHQAIALRLAIDMKLFDAATGFSSDGNVIPLEDPSSKMDADPLLVSKYATYCPFRTSY
jgi:hypothetical protein